MLYFTMCFAGYCDDIGDSRIIQGFYEAFGWPGRIAVMIEQGSVEIREDQKMGRAFGHDRDQPYHLSVEREMTIRPIVAVREHMFVRACMAERERAGLNIS